MKNYKKYDGSKKFRHIRMNSQAKGNTRQDIYLCDPDV